MSAHRVVRAFVALTVLIALTAISSPAQAGGTGVIHGVVSGDTSAGWDSLATVTATPASGSSITVPTDGSGNYTITVPTGSYRITFKYTGTANFVGTFYGGLDRPYLDVPADGTQTVDAVLEVGASISGTISGSTGAVDRPYVLATATSPNGQFSSRSTVAATGEYTIDRLPSGTIRLRFGSISGDWIPQVSTLTLAAHEVRTGYNVVLDPTTTLAVSPEIEGANYGVFGVAVDLYRDGALKETRTAGNVGPAMFEGLTPGDYTVCMHDADPNPLPGAVEVDADQWQPECWENVGPGGISTPVTLALGDHADVRPQMVRNIQISGAVYGAVSGGVIPLFYATAELLRESPAGSGTYVPAASTTDGYFTFSNVPPGRYILRLSDGDRGWFRTAYYPGVASATDAIPIVVNSFRDIQLPWVTLAGGEYTTTRLSGANRFETGVAISRAQFQGADSAGDHPAAAVPVVYVASGLDYPDALSAVPAAIAQGGSILLVRPDAIPDSVRAELARLRPSRIVVVGGTATISADVFSELQTYSGIVDRIGGANRYETSALIVRDAFEGQPVSDVLVTTARNFPDALAAGPAAGSVGSPIILVDGAAGGLSAETADLIRDLNANTAWVIGGASSISPAIETDLRELGLTTTRIAGADRYETATNVNAEFFPGSSSVAILAAGGSFADALAGGALAGSLGAPIYLATPTCVPGVVVRFLLTSVLHKVTLLGGTQALNDDVARLKPCT